MQRPYAPFRHNIDGADHARAFRVTNAGGLNVSVAAGRHRIDQTVTNFPNPTNVLLPAVTLSYVYINNAGAIASNAVAYPGGSWPLARVQTGAATITTITDDRAMAASVDTGAGVASKPHQYFFVPDAAPGVDVGTGPQITKYATSGAAEPVPRITVHSGAAGGGNFVFDIEQGNNEDQDAGGFAWVLFKTITVPAGQLTFVDALPAVATTARRPLRINITSNPNPGWQDMNIIVEAQR